MKYWTIKTASSTHSFLSWPGTYRLMGIYSGKNVPCWAYREVEND